MKKISAEVVADSINPQGDRVTTMLVTFPRFILAELNTHRMFSKNSASSRAIPFEKMVKMVEEDPFIPIAWQKDHRGMQGTEYITNPDHINFRIGQWLNASKKAITSAEELNAPITRKTSWDGIGEDVSEGITKQLVNRLLEPFMWHTVLITATGWDNFFNLRCPSYGGFAKDGKNTSFKSKQDVRNYFKSINLNTKVVDDQDFYSWQAINTSGAEIHMQALAEAMWDAMNESVPKELEAGEWHIPFGDKMNTSPEDSDSLWQAFKNLRISGQYEYESIPTEVLIATARCARLSYMTFDNEINYKKDIKLHDQLLESIHLSPFEHCCRAMSGKEFVLFHKGKLNDPIVDEEGNMEFFYAKHGWCNNFKGFIQYRYLLENE